MRQRLTGDGWTRDGRRSAEGDHAGLVSRVNGLKRLVTLLSYTTAVTSEKHAVSEVEGRTCILYRFELFFNYYLFLFF